MKIATARPPFPSTKWHSILLILVVITIFAFTDALAKYLSHRYPVPGLVWARYAIQTLFMLAVWGPRLGWSLMRTAYPGLQVIRALLLLSTTLLTFNALRFLPLAEASAIFFVAPILITVISVPLLKEKIKPGRWVAVIAGFCGILIILRPNGGLFTPAALFPLGTAVCYSFYQIVTRQLSESENALTSLFYPAVVGAVVMLVVLPFSWVPPTPFDGMLIIALGLFGGVGHFVLIKALDHASASTLAPFSYCQLIWATLIGYFAFGTLPDQWAFVGMGVIAASGLYIAFDER